MATDAPLTRLAAGSLLLLLVTTAPAMEVTLDSGTAMTSNGEMPLKVDGRARFEFAPDTGTLTSSGSWTAQYLFGPNQLPRLTHKLEDLVASSDGKMSLKSYECVEGTLGGVLASNSCGNYRFGPNGIDDGGVGDDVIVGQPKSLASFLVSALIWDGEFLLLILSTDGTAAAAVFPEFSLEFRFSAVKPKPGSRQPSAR